MFIPVLYISSLIHIFSTDYMSEDPAECLGKTFKWGKLSNSGDILKLQVPSQSRKAMSGWTNHPCTVISLMIDENQMDNRGSKSEFVTDSVKEQRVDGSYCIQASTSRLQLRCTLMNFERFSRVKFPSNQLNVRKFSTSNSSSNVNPWFWTGLIDAEGSFSVIVVIIIIFITDNNYLDTVNIAPYFINYCFIPTIVVYNDSNSKDKLNNSTKESKVSEVRVYYNADTDNSKIFLDNKGKAGIYQWTHKESGKFYIGSAFDLGKRFNCYYSPSYLIRFSCKA